jgi:hypothetical protein
MIDPVIDVYALLFALGCASIATLLALFLLFLITVVAEFLDDDDGEEL